MYELLYHMIKLTVSNISSRLLSASKWLASSVSYLLIASMLYDSIIRVTYAPEPISHECGGVSSLRQCHEFFVIHNGPSMWWFSVVIGAGTRWRMRSHNSCSLTGGRNRWYSWDVWRSRNVEPKKQYVHHQIYPIVHNYPRSKEAYVTLFNNYCYKSHIR